MTIPSWFVIAMGLGTVFIGLSCIIVLCKILGAACSLLDKKKQQTASSVPSAIKPAVPAAKRQEIIAAIGVAIAEETGVAPSAIRITSIKKI